MRNWIWGLIITLFILASLVPTFYEISRAQDLHPDRYFELVHNFYTDYNFYLSRIREGREGAWTATEKYTSEPHKGSYIQVFYVWMGEVSAWVGVPWHKSGDTYHTARVVLAFALLFLLAYAVRSLFVRFRWQLTAFLLAVTAASWPFPVFHMGEWRFGGYMPWWTIMDSLQRLTFIPHLLAGQALMFFLLLALSTEGTMKRAGNWIFLGIIAFILGILYPPGLLFTGFAYGTFVVIDFIFTKPHSLKQIGGGFVVFLMSAPTLLYFSLMTEMYPWKRLVENDVLHGQPFVLPEYLLAVGPVLVIGVLGALWVLWKREKKFFVLVAWVLAWFLCLIIFQYIPQQSPLRFTEMAPQIPLGILGAYLLSNVSDLRYLRNWSKIPIMLVMLLILIGLGQMYSSWRWQKEFIDQKIAATYPLVPTGSTVMYPLNDFVGAIIYIQDHTKRTDVILSETTAGNYIPVYSGNTVYVGQANTVRAEQKEYIVQLFYSGQMTESAAQAFLAANNMHYVFFGPQEMGDGTLTDLSKTYPFLHEAYANPQFHVYAW